MTRNVEGGRRLRALLEKSRSGDVTQEEYAARLGVTKAALQSWFSGTPPSFGNFAVIAEALGMRRWELVRTWDEG